MGKPTRLLVILGLFLLFGIGLSGCGSANTPAPGPGPAPAGPGGPAPAGPGGPAPAGPSGSGMLVQQTVTVSGGGGSAEVSFSGESGWRIRITMTSPNPNLQPYGYLGGPGGSEAYQPPVETAGGGRNSAELTLTQSGSYSLTVFDGSNQGGEITVTVEHLP